MARKTKDKPETPQADTALTLPGKTGEPLVVFPATVVRPLRHMVTLLVTNGAFPARLALVAALREEGVTYTALAVATILAHDMAGTVGLVELNWGAPGLARLMTGAPGAGAATAGPSGGLAAVVTGRATLDEALVWTGLPNLALLPAGELDAEIRATIVRGARLREIVAELAGRFDHLLLDVPAVAATSDAIPLARLGDALLLVIRQGVTPRRVVAAALDDLNQCTMLGVVLNRAKVATPALILKFIPQE
jgi:Mrp family chromosome partitioning ATPase